MELYENNYYKQERIKKQTVSIMIPHSAVIQNTKCTLQEPLILDSRTEVYLDSIVSGSGSKLPVQNLDFYALKIDELQCKNIGATLANPGLEHGGGALGHTTVPLLNNLRNSLHNTIIIPNNRTSTAQPVNHRNNKFNYISSLNPQKIDYLTVSLGWLNTGTAVITDEVFRIDYAGLLQERSGHTLINLVFVSSEQKN